MSLTEDDVHGYVRGVCFKKGPPGLVGAETEWLVEDKRRPGEHVAVERLRVPLMRGALPGGSRVTFEPGGQLELSSRALPGAEAACAALAADLAEVRRRLPWVELVGAGVDPVRPSRMQLDELRYRCMSRYFGDVTMMCSTASVQVCLDIGTEEQAARRWRLAHWLGPVLTASFANSPLREGRRTGWKSTRQAVWSRLDPSRTDAPPEGDPEETWARYALDAQVMLIRGQSWVIGPGMTFREWMRLGSPTLDDFAYHLTTLFPPVRPQGWLELRMIDALPEPFWCVPIAVAAALIDLVPQAAEAAAEPVAGRWVEAARDGLRDPALAKAALTCFEAACSVLDGPLKRLTEQYAERYVARGLCPADDVKEYAWTR